MLFKDHSRHTLQITTKSAHKGFKIYSLCKDNYLLSFIFASKSSRISELKTVRQLGLLPKDKLTPSALLVIQLCKELSSSLNYHLFCDNFFTITKLFNALRSIGIVWRGHTCYIDDQVTGQACAAESRDKRGFLLSFSPAPLHLHTYISSHLYIYISTHIIFVT